MDISKLDHLIIKTPEEKQREEDNRLRELGGRFIQWAMENNVSEKDLAIVCYNYYRNFQDESAKLNNKEETT